MASQTQIRKEAYALQVQFSDLLSIERRVAPGREREAVISLLQQGFNGGYIARLTALRTERAAAQAYADSRRAGTAVKEAADTQASELQRMITNCVNFLGQVLEKHDICSACYGKGHEGGWTCPACNGNGRGSKAAFYCAGPCRKMFSPTTEHQTYCVNCRHLAPNAQAAGLEENEWRAIARDVLGIVLYCKQYECSVCRGTGQMGYSFDSAGTATPRRCGYCYPAPIPPSAECEKCRAPFTPTEQEGRFCQDCRAAIDRRLAELDRTFQQGRAVQAEPATTELDGFKLGDSVKVTLPFGDVRTYQITKFEKGRAYLHCPDQEDASYWEWPRHLARLVPSTEPSTEPAPTEKEGTDMAEHTAPAIVMTVEDRLMALKGPEATYVGTFDRHHLTRFYQGRPVRSEWVEGFVFDWLMVVPRDQALDVVMTETGEVLQSFSGDDWAACAQFVYQSLLSGLVSTLYGLPRATNQPAAPEPPQAATVSPNGYQGMLDRIAALEANVGLIPTGIDNLSSRLEAVEDLAELVDQRLAGLADQVTGFRNLIELHAQDHRATPLHDHADPQDTQTYTLRTELAGLHKRIAVLEANNDRLETLLGALQTAREVQADTIDALLTAFSSLQASHNTLATNHNALAGEVLALWHALKHGVKAEGTEPQPAVVGEAEQALEKCPACNGTGFEALGVGCSVCQGEGKRPKVDPKLQPGTAEHMIGMMEDPNHGPCYIEWAIWVLGHRQEADELAANSTEHLNGVGFNSADANYGTSLFKWLSTARYSQPHLTAKQLPYALKIVRKYISTQLVPNAQAYGGPHSASPFQAGDWVVDTTKADQTPRRIAVHDWLYVYFEGNGYARWFDCAQAAPAKAEPSAAADALTDVTL